MIALLVIENRPKMFTDHVEWLVEVASEAEILFWQGEKAPIWYMRRKMIERALEGKFTHILFIDTDVVPPDNFIQELLARDKDVVSGVYHTFKGIPCSRKNGQFYQGSGLEEVDVCSIGACLIKRKVLEKVQYPRAKPGDLDADYEFCAKVKKAGFKIYQDFSLTCFHIQVVPFIKS